MPFMRSLFFIFLLGFICLSGLTTASQAAEACLDRAEQRAAVASHQAVPLASAIRGLQGRERHAEVVRAELCRRGGRLVYVLTLLPRSGKVSRVVIDATNGRQLGG